MAHLICYDITNNTLRASISKTLLDFGLDRINKSVYLGTIKDSSLKELVGKLTAQMQKRPSPDDSLIVLPVQAHQIQAMQIFGKNDLDKDELTGDKTTLII